MTDTDSTRWVAVVENFHDRVKRNCRNATLNKLINLHRPDFQQDPPVCQGCDTLGGPRAPRPPWPCYTYRVMAADVLNYHNSSDIDHVLKLMTQSARTIRPLHP